MKQKIITDDNIHDELQKRGIVTLTSEADGTGLRLLCDLTEDGQALLEGFLDLSITPARAWNCGAGSVMLPKGIFKSLLIFAVFLEGADAVVIVDYDGPTLSSHHIRVISDLERDQGGKIIWSCEWEELKERLTELIGSHFRVYTREGTAAGGLRNQHVFSGRIK